MIYTLRKIYWTKCMDEESLSWILIWHKYRNHRGIALPGKENIIITLAVSAYCLGDDQSKYMRSSIWIICHASACRISPWVIVFDYYSRSTQKSPVRQQNAWFDTKMPGSTQKCPVRHKNTPQHVSVDIAITQHPPSCKKHFFPILFKYFVFKNP